MEWDVQWGDWGGGSGESITKLKIGRQCGSWIYLELINFSNFPLMYIPYIHTKTHLASDHNHKLPINIRNLINKKCHTHRQWQQNRAQSTIHQSHQIVDSIFTFLESGQYCSGVFFWCIALAFDRVRHCSNSKGHFHQLASLSLNPTT